MIKITTENWEMALYAFVQGIVSKKYNAVPTVDQQDMVQDVYLSMRDNYLRNGNKPYFKYTAEQVVCRYCDAWVKKHSSSSVSLNDVHLMYVIDDSQARYREICQLLNEHTVLSERNVQVIQLFYNEHQSFAEIGNTMNLHPERVRQILAASIRKYRRTCNKLGIFDCL